MEIRSFSIDELKKKAVEIRLSILNAITGAEPGHSFELGTRSELHEKVRIRLNSVVN